jgi:hypothetical protein
MPDYPADQGAEFPRGGDRLESLRTEVRILALRVETLGKEKERVERDLEDERESRHALDRRVAIMEKTFQRGAGIALALPILGTVFGVLLAYGKVIFAPWMGGGGK